MLDAGPAKDQFDDKHIKHFTDFETRVICRLIESPYYIGRGFSCKNKDPEKYIKNKQICKLIDEIRYNCGFKKIIYVKNHSAKLNYKGFVQSLINGGDASATYGFAQQLDLGSA